MSRTCTICSHPDLGSIDAALVAGEPYRGIAQRFEASSSAVYRHQQDHLPTALAKAKEAEEVAHGGDLLDQVRSLQGKALAILTKAESSGDLRSALGAVREARGCLELLAKMLGMMKDRHEVDVRVYGRFVIGTGYGEPEEPTVVEGEVVGVDRRPSWS